MPTYLGLFEKSGKMARPFADAGWRCVCVDIENDNNERDGIKFVRDNLTFWDAKWAATYEANFIAAFPPCDHLAVSGARWFKGKGLRKLAQSIELFAVAAEICEASGAPYFIENPVSTISTYWRKPDHTFHPNDYAGFCAEDTYTKKTCLWTGGGFVMPEPCPLEGVEPDDRIHKAAPGPDRKDFRSATPLGFARAVFAANHSLGNIAIPSGCDQTGGVTPFGNPDLSPERGTRSQTQQEGARPSPAFPGVGG